MGERSQVKIICTPGYARLLAHSPNPMQRPSLLLRQPRIDQTEARVRIKPLAQMGGSFLQNDFQSRPDIATFEMPGKRCAVPFAQNEMDMKRRRAGFIERDIAGQ